MADLLSDADAPSSVPPTRDQDRMRRLADLLDPKETPNWTPREAAHVLCGVDPERDISDCVQAETGEILLRLLPGIAPPSSGQDWSDLHRSLSEDIDRMDERLRTLNRLGFMPPLDIVHKVRKAGITPPWWGLWTDHNLGASQSAKKDAPARPEGADLVAGITVTKSDLAKMGGEARARTFVGLHTIEERVRQLNETGFKGYRKTNGKPNVSKLTTYLVDSIGNNPQGKPYSETAVRKRVEKALEKILLPAQF